MEKLVSSTDAAHRSLLSRSVLFRFASISLIVLFVSAGVTESSAPPAPPLDRDKMVATNDDVSKSDIRLVFSDVDGTLVHYPSKTVASDEGNQIIKLPPSATGMQGVISSRTLVLCRELRRQQTATLVLVSGMRTTTLLKRLPYLPRADAYCSEAGGRIFYPIDPNAGGYDGLVFQPEAFSGATQSDLVPFGLVEDMDWRRRMERGAGTGGYERNGLNSDVLVSSVVERKGLLWDFARDLTEKGYVLDTNGYATCFRVNRKQQKNITEKEFDALVSGEMPHPRGLATSTNLGCVDFYPVESGKRNCCLYLAQRFCSTDKEHVLSKHAICLCDDDNDLAMAMACNHAFVPDVNSDSMADMIRAYPEQLTKTGGPGSSLEGTEATEKALELALRKVHGQ